MNLYEIVLLIKQEETKTNIPVYKDRITEILNSEPGASCQKYEYWGFRKLAYPIEGFTYANYIFIGINCSYTSLKKITEYIKSAQKIIRHSIIKVKKISAEESPIMHDSDIQEKKQQTQRYPSHQEHAKEESVA